MKNHLYRSLIFFFFAVGLSNCVSVNLPSSSGSPAKDVKFDAPASPFEDMKVKTADKAWISKNTGNTISFLSDCNSSSDPTLQQLQSESLAVLDNLKVLDSKDSDFNGRESNSTFAQGEVDGVPVKTEILVFKKNGCNFTLSYGGVLSRFEAEKKFFDKFKESFKAQ